MNLKTLILASALAAMSSSAFAACKEYVTVTPDNAPVLGPVVKSVVVGQTSGGPDHNGTAYTKATFCPVKAAPGTCTGESLSTFVAGPVYGPKTFIEVVANNGNVPDVVQHKNGIAIPATQWTPAVFIPTTPLLAGAC